MNAELGMRNAEWEFTGHRWYSCCYDVILDTRLSILDNAIPHVQIFLAFIEHPVSSIEYQVLNATSNE
jgi:hypothetical protein